MNGLGLMGFCLLSVGVPLLALCIQEINLWIILPLVFVFFGSLAIIDDIILNERVTKWVLGIEKETS